MTDPQIKEPDPEIIACRKECKSLLTILDQQASMFHPGYVPLAGIRPIVARIEERLAALERRTEPPKEDYK